MASDVLAKLVETGRFDGGRTFILGHKATPLNRMRQARQASGSDDDATSVVDKRRPGTAEGPFAVSGEEVRAALQQRAERSAPARASVHLRGVQVTGDVDLRGIDGLGLIELEDIRLDGALVLASIDLDRLIVRRGFLAAIDLTDLRCGGVDLTNLYLERAITAQRLQVSGALTLDQLRPLRDGPLHVDLAHADIGTSLTATRNGQARQKRDGDWSGLVALHAPNSRVHGNVVILSSALDALDLGSTQVGGSFQGDDLRVRDAIRLRNAAVTGEVMLSSSHALADAIAIDLSQASIGTHLGLPSLCRRGAGKAIVFADAVRVGGVVSVPGSAVSTIHLRGAVIGGSLILSGLRGDHVSLINARIGGEVLLNNAVLREALTSCDMRTAEIGGDIFLTGSRLSGSFLLDDGRCRGALIIDNAEIRIEAAGQACLSLNNAAVSQLLVHTSRLSTRRDSYAIDATGLTATGVHFRGVSALGAIKVEHARLSASFVIEGGRINGGSTSLNLDHARIDGNLEIFGGTRLGVAWSPGSRDVGGDAYNHPAMLRGTVQLRNTVIAGNITFFRANLIAPQGTPAFYARSARLGAVIWEKQEKSPLPDFNRDLGPAADRGQGGASTRQEKLIEGGPGPGDISSLSVPTNRTVVVEIAAASGAKALEGDAADHLALRSDAAAGSAAVENSGPASEVALGAPEWDKPKPGVRTRGPIALIGTEVENEAEFGGLAVKAWTKGEWEGLAIYIRDCTIRTRFEIGSTSRGASALMGQVALIDNRFESRVTFAGVMIQAPRSSRADIGQEMKALWARNCVFESDVFFYDPEADGGAVACDFWGETSIINCRVAGEIDLGTTSFRPLTVFPGEAIKDDKTVRNITKQLCYAAGVPPRAVCLSLRNTAVEGDLLLGEHPPSGKRIGLIDLAGFSARTIGVRRPLQDANDAIGPAAEITPPAPSTDDGVAGPTSQYWHLDPDGRQPWCQQGVSINLEGSRLERIGAGFDWHGWLTRYVPNTEYSKAPGINRSEPDLVDLDVFERMVTLLRAAGRLDEAREATLLGLEKQRQLGRGPGWSQV